MKKYIKWIICFLSLIAFIILCYMVKTDNEIVLDSIVYNFISKFINEGLTNIVKIITCLGGAVFVIVTTIVMFLALKNKKIGIIMSINLIVITIFQYVLKAIFGRVRPIGINIIEESNFSFPSGHSLTAVAFYGFIIYLLYKSNLKHKKIYITLLGVLILLIGLSRVYLGVHFITDVLGGFTFSLFYLIIFIQITKKHLL